MGCVSKLAALRDIAVTDEAVFASVLGRRFPKAPMPGGRDSGDSRVGSQLAKLAEGCVHPFGEGHRATEADNALKPLRIRNDRTWGNAEASGSGAVEA
jgi:hypothetical protein